MNKIKILKISSVLIFTGLLNLSAQNYNDAARLTEPRLQSNAKALGLGNAYTALSNDFLGSFFNPAGFGLVKKTELTASFSHNNIAGQTDFLNNTFKDDDGTTDFNQIGIVLPFATTRGSFALNFGYTKLADFTRKISFDGFNNSSTSMIQDLTNYNDNVAFELALSYPIYNGNTYLYDETKINGQLNQRGKMVNTGGMDAWVMGFSAEIAKDIFFGGTLNLIRGEFTRTRDYYEEDTKNIYGLSTLLDDAEPKSADFQSFYFRDIIDWEINNSEWKFGLLGKINENFNAGITVTLPRSFSIKENYTVTGRSEFGTGTIFEISPSVQNYSKYEIKLPYEARFGAAYNYNNLTVTADLQIQDNTKIEFTEGFSSSEKFDKNQDISEILASVTNIFAGAEYRLSDYGLALRGGFMYIQSPYANDPSEYHKKYVTAGIGYKVRNDIFIDAAYAFGWWKDMGDNYSSSVSRTYQDYSKSIFTASVRIIM